MNLQDHPTVKQLYATGYAEGAPRHEPLDAHWLRQLALECGADGAGVVEIDRPALDSQREELLLRYPWTKTLLSFVVRMSREPVRSPGRSSPISNSITPATRSTKPADALWHTSKHTASGQ